MKHTTQPQKMNEGWAIDTASRSKTHYYKNGISLCGRENEKHYFRNFEKGSGSIYPHHCAICAKILKHLEHLQKSKETETHEYLDHPDGGFASEEVPASKEPLGITPGEWIADPKNNWCVINKEKGYPIFSVNNSIDRPYILTAVNSTYKKGYDPLQVDALYKALAEMLQQFPQRGVILTRREQKAINEAEQALKNAKL